MQTVSTIGVHIAKSVFQVRGVDADGLVVKPHGASPLARWPIHHTEVLLQRTLSPIDLQRHFTRTICSDAQRMVESHCWRCDFGGRDLWP